MPDSTISALTAAAVLDGTEALPIAQLTSTVRTTTQAIANLASATSAKINTVSNTLSNLISLHNVLSNRVSANSAVGGGSVGVSAQAASAIAVASAAATSADAHANAASAALSLAVSALQTSIQTASAAATSADGHANVASAAATSVDARVNTLSQTLSAVSALSVGVAANGLQSAINALSNTISAVSAAVTSVDTRVNTVSNTVSQHTVSLAQLSNATSLLNNVSAKSAATSVKGLQSVVNQLSNRISAVVGGAGITSDQASAMIHSVLSTEYSARTSVGGATSIKGLQSVIDTFSVEFVNEVSIRAASVQTASAAATSVDTRVNTVSNLVSQHTVSLAQLSNAVSLLNNVSTASAATSVKGLQSVIVQISNRLSAISAAATSVDTRVNTVSNTVSQHTVSLAQLSNAVSLLNNVSTASAATSVKGLQSVIVQISNRLSAISAAATSVDTRVNTVSNTVSQHTVSLAALSNTVSAVSAAVTSVDTRLNTVSNTVSQNVVSLAALSNAVSLLNNVSAVSAATSVKGLQSVINQMSNRISAIVLGGGGMTSDQASAMIHSVLTTQYSARTSIGGATSTKGLQSALDDLSLQISSLNSVVSNALSAGDVISATIVSVQSTVSHLASIVSLVSTVSAAGTAVGLQSVVNALSARIVAGASATSAEVQTASAAATSVDQRVTSVNNLWTSGLGTNVVLGKCTNGHAMTPGASFTNVSGCAVALVANGDYQIDGRVFFSLSIVTGTRFGFSYNTTGNGQMVKGAMDMRCATSVIAAAISNMVSTNWSYGHINEAAMSNAATANISITGISATTYMLEIEGMLQNGNSAVTLNLQAAHSAAGGGINILAGSFIRAYRIV